MFQQLTAFVSLLRPNPSIPVLVLASSGMEQDHLAHWIQLKMGMQTIMFGLRILKHSTSADFKLFVQQCSVISDVHFSTLSFPGDLSSHHHPSSLGEEEVEEEEQEGLLGGLLWLAAHSPSQPQLYHLPLHEHLEQGVCVCVCVCVCDCSQAFCFRTHNSSDDILFCRYRIFQILAKNHGL